MTRLTLSTYSSLLPRNLPHIHIYSHFTYIYFLIVHFARSSSVPLKQVSYIHIIFHHHHHHHHPNYHRYIANNINIIINFYALSSAIYQCDSHSLKISLHKLAQLKSMHIIEFISMLVLSLSIIACTYVCIYLYIALLVWQKGRFEFLALYVHTREHTCKMIVHGRI